MHIPRCATTCSLCTAQHPRYLSLGNKGGLPLYHSWHGTNHILKGSWNKYLSDCNSFCIPHFHILFNLYYLYQTMRFYIFCRTPTVCGVLIYRLRSTCCSEVADETAIIHYLIRCINIHNVLSLIIYNLCP